MAAKNGKDLTIHGKGGGGRVPAKRVKKSGSGRNIYPHRYEGTLAIPDLEAKGQSSTGSAKSCTALAGSDPVQRIWFCGQIVNNVKQTWIADFTDSTFLQHSVSNSLK
jgi:hypothetical protein